MLKLIDNSVPAIQPPIEIHLATSGKAAETLTFGAAASLPEAPVLSCHWDFGDGSSLDGMKVQHAYTHPGEYDVHVTATGLDAITNSKTLTVSISGNVSTRFVPADKRRPK
jgi:PKD repeat protein